MIVLGISLAFGPTFHPRNDVSVTLPFPMPYAILYSTLPGFTALRVPSRFDALVILGLAPLAGEGLVCLLAAVKSISPRLIFSRRLPSIVGGACLAVLLLESADRLPSEPVRTGASIPAVYRWLAIQSKPSPTVEIPIDTDAFEESPRAYYSTYHSQPLVNGSRSFLPPGYETLAGILATFPGRDATATMSRLGVRYVLVHRSELPRLTARSLPVANADVRRIAQFGSDDVYEVVGPNPPQAMNVVVSPPCLPKSGESAQLAVTLEATRELSLSILPPGVESLDFVLDSQGRSGSTQREAVRATLPSRIVPLPATISLTYHPPPQPDNYTLTVTLPAQSGLEAAKSTVFVPIQTESKSVTDAAPTLAVAKLMTYRGHVGDGIPFELGWQRAPATGDQLIEYVNAYDDEGRYWSLPLVRADLAPNQAPSCTDRTTLQGQRLRLLPQTPAGSYHIEAGVMSLTTGRRVPFVGPDRITVTKYDLGTYQVLPPSAIQNGAPVTPTDSRTVFGNAIALDYADVAGPIKPGTDLPVELQWSSVRNVPTDYSIFVHVTDSTGRVVAQSDHLAGGREFPTSSWQVGDTFYDEEKVELPGDLPPGQLGVEVGLYDLATMKRLSVTSSTGDGSADSVSVRSTQP
jgi:hypothetical protein